MKQLLKLIVASLVLATLVIALQPATAILAQGDEFPIAQGVVRARNGTPIYAEPDIYSETVGMVANGDVLDIYELEGLYARVDGGWVIAGVLNIGPAHVNLQGVAETRSDFAIRATPDISGEVLKTVPSGTVLGVITLDGLFAQVYDGDILGWAFVSDLALSEPTADLTDFAQSSAVTRARSEIAVRAEADITAEVLSTTTAGLPARVLAMSEDHLFAYVMLEDGTTGWVFTANLTIQPRAVARGTLNSGPVNFRETPADDGFVLNYLPFNGEVLLLGRTEDGAWLKVRYPGEIFVAGESLVGAEGWISADVFDTDYDLANLPVVE